MQQQAASPPAKHLCRRFFVIFVKMIKNMIYPLFKFYKMMYNMHKYSFNAPMGERKALCPYKKEVFMITNLRRGAPFRVLALCLCCVLLLGGLSSMILPAASVRVPYVLHIAELSGQPVNILQEFMCVREGYALPIGGEVRLTGWLATEEGVDYYEYAWVPVSGGSPDWEQMDTEIISNRPDLTQAGILYPTGHATAGFDLTICPKNSMTDGYYDLYVRAVTGGGSICDVLVLVNVAYGAPDKDENGIYSFSLSRLEREQGALTNCKLQDGKLVLHENGVARLGELNLALFESIRVTYSVPRPFSTEKQAVLGLKSSGEHPYGNGEGKYDLTDSLLYMPIESRQNTTPVVAELRLDALDLSYSGEVYLCGYTGGNVIIHSIELFYKGQGYSRTAAKLYFSEDSAAYMSTVSKVTFAGEKDPVFGDVLRFNISEDTNDPYAFFNAETLMAEHGVKLNADEYRYMVLLLRAAPHNHNDRFIMYLCSGTIMGPTEDCTYGLTLEQDNQWHYYLVDLSEKATWDGKIHGWRFDVLNGDSYTGDYVDVATVQFFRTVEAAEKAAAASVTTCETPYAKGQPALYKDMQEEQTQNKDDFVIPPEDAYVETAPETQSETLVPAVPEDTWDGQVGEAVTLPAAEGEEHTHEASTQAKEEMTAPPVEPDVTQADTSADTQEKDGDASSEESGCTSAYGAGTLLMTVAFLAVVCLLFRRREHEICQEI